MQLDYSYTMIFIALNLAFKEALKTWSEHIHTVASK